MYNVPELSVGKVVERLLSMRGRLMSHEPSAEHSATLLSAQDILTQAFGGSLRLELTAAPEGGSQRSKLLRCHVLIARLARQPA